MPSDASQEPPAPVRNAAVSRDKLLAAATRAFAASGFAGVRVAAVAQSAGVNKAMIYHYFGDKEGLYQAVLNAALAPLLSQPAATGTDVPAALSGFQAHLGVHLTPEVIRLLVWDGLRERSAATALDRIPEPLSARPPAESAAQRDGEDVSLLLLAIAVLPRVCPQAVTALTGLDPDSTAFGARWQRLQRRLSGLIAARYRGDKERISLRPATGPSANSGS